MAFGSFDSRSPGSAMSEINMVPLIDVMLVLLVIFIITAPLLSHSIRIDVPRVTAQPVAQDTRVVDLAIDAAGTLFWDGEAIGQDGLAARLAAEAGADPQPAIRIRADAATRYDVLAEVMGAARQAGVKRLGFVTRPGDVAPAGQAMPSGEAARPAPPAGVIPRAGPAIPSAPHLEP